MKKLLNIIRKILANVTKNKNIKVDAYLYDMTSKLGEDITVINRYENQYIFTDGKKTIFKLNQHRTIDVLDMVKFQKIKNELKSIGGTPRHAFYNIDKLFNSKLRNGKKPIAITFKR